MKPHTHRARVPAAVAALALATSGCAGTTPESESGGELVWTLPAVFESLQATADRWNELNPDTPVRLELLPESADGQRQQLALELDAEGSGFDILGLDVIWTGEFAENGWLEPLDDLRPEVDDALLPGALESATWNDQLWAVPYISGSAFLYYRSDLVDEPPDTWQELMEVGLAVGEEEGIAPFVGQGAQYEGMVVNYLEYLWSAGGDLFSDDGTQVRFGDGDAAMTALEFMRQSLDSGFYAPGYNTMMEEEARNEFQSGNAVFMRNWPYAYPLMSDEAESDVAGSFDIAPMPTFTGRDTISAVGGINNAVSAFSENKEAAREFVMFAATDPDAQFEVGSEFSQLPVLSSTYDQLADDPVFAVLADVVPYARPRPPVPEWNEISVTMQREIFSAYNGEKDPQQAIDAVRAMLDGVVG
jgi:multiple sugar transport system substrate-binding protein